MDPIGHVLVAYLVWTGYSHLRYRRSPTTPEVWLVGVGSQLPDIVDKPLAWWLGVLPSGRSLGHSLLTAAVLVLVLRRVVPSERRSLVAPLAVSLVGHDLVDAIAPISRGEFGYLAYLLWPIVDLPAYDPPPPLLSAIGESLLRGISGPDVLVIAAVVVVWIADGYPGLPRRRTAESDRADRTRRPE